MWKWSPPDPNSEGGKYVKVKITGNRIEVWPGPECTLKEPKPGRPIPPEDKR
jgi:hypothetical protein